MFFSFDHEHVVMNLTFRNPRPFKNNPQTSNLKAFNKTYNNKSKRFQMGKRRASELSTKRMKYWDSPQIRRILFMTQTETNSQCAKIIIDLVW